LVCLQFYVLVLTLGLAVYTLFEKKQDQIWAKIICIPKNMHSRTPMALHISLSEPYTYLYLL